MARLNEPAQPVIESIDALKRRFVRQNREIARANSTQSVRIRTLECEVSRLLGENLSLRGEVAKLNHEAERLASKSVLQGVDIVKEKLEAKLSELGTLVRALGDVEQTARIERTKRRRSINRDSVKGSPSQKNWRNTLTLSEAVGGADGRLPPIVEGKHYPRHTLDAEELLDVVTDPANVTDSPDLGPPPVAHFEEGDPIKFDTRSKDPPIQVSPTNDEEANPKLSANLETRKKRRQSSYRKDGETGRASADYSKISSKESGGTSQPLKSGAKRKLNIREEETPEVAENTDKDAMHTDGRAFDSRRSEARVPDTNVKKSSNSNSSKSSHGSALSTRGGKEKTIEAPGTGSTTTRRALGPKSVNSDPMNSPLKNGRGIPKDKVAEAKDDLAKIVQERNRPKDKPQDKGTDQPKKQEAVFATKALIGVPKPVEHPPETPVPPPNDLLSPGNSEPSVPRADLRDTPPPPDLGPNTGAGSFGRASRRPKGTVNYAQPNLRDKMRRPTAELVDAVAAEERARQASIAKAAKEAWDGMPIKQEPSMDILPIWKTNEPKESHRTLEEPTSPLKDKTGTSSTSLPSSVITERRRPTFVPTALSNEDCIARPSSGAASAIAALTAGSHKLKRHEEDLAEPIATGIDEKVQSSDRSSIYNFTGSSPPGNGGSEEDTNIIDEMTKPRASRRHSTVSATSDQSKGVLSISRRGHRQRESILDERQDENSRPAIARTKSVLKLGDGVEERILGRGERAASRRRSMML